VSLFGQRPTFRDCLCVPLLGSECDPDDVRTEKLLYNTSTAAKAFNRILGSCIRHETTEVTCQCINKVVYEIRKRIGRLLRH
jgi:hypothetical protein